MPLAANDMTTSTTATEECAAQVRPAARITSSTGCGRDRARAACAGWRILEGREQLQELVQCRQHQAEADQHAAEVARPGAGAAEHQDPDQDQHGRDVGDVEGEDLDDQRGADIGAQHDRERRHEIDQPAGGEAGDHQPGRRAALQHGGHADTRQEGA